MKPSDLRTILDHADPRWHLRPVLLALLKLWEAAAHDDSPHAAVSEALRDLENIEP
jgi:hypothetical protein